MEGVPNISKILQVPVVNYRIHTTVEAPKKEQ